VTPGQSIKEAKDNAETLRINKRDAKLRAQQTIKGKSSWFTHGAPKFLKKSIKDIGNDKANNWFTSGEYHTLCVNTVRSNLTSPSPRSKLVHSPAGKDKPDPKIVAKQQEEDRKAEFELLDDKDDSNFVKGGN
jgi:hypothetical protein